MFLGVPILQHFRVVSTPRPFTTVKRREVIPHEHRQEVILSEKDKQANILKDDPETIILCCYNKVVQYNAT